MAAIGPRRSALALLIGLAGLGIFASGCGAAPTSSVPLTPGGGSWAPDGSAIARERPDGIEVANPEGRRIRLIQTPRPYRRLGWSANGRRLFFLTRERRPTPERDELAASVRSDGGDGTHLAYTASPIVDSD